MQDRISKPTAVNLVGEEHIHVPKLVVDHKGQKSHHGSTALIQLDGALLKLGLFIEGIPAVVDVVVTEVTWEFSSSDVLHDAKLQGADEEEDLVCPGDRNLAGSLPSGGDVGELGSG